MTDDLGAPQNPAIWVQSLETRLVNILVNLEDESIKTALIQTMPDVISQLHAATVNPEAEPAARDTAMNSLMWLLSVVLKAEVRLSRIAAEAESAKARRARHESVKAKAKADEASVIITVSKERKKIARQLKQAEKDMERQSAIDALNRQIAEAPDKLSKLQLKQQLLKLKGRK